MTPATFMFMFMMLCMSTFLIVAMKSESFRSWLCVCGGGGLAFCGWVWGRVWVVV